MRFGTSAKKYLAAVAVALLLLSLGGGFLLGRESGTDLPAARAFGDEQGKRLGTRTGASVGYVVGLKRGYPDYYDGAFFDGYVTAFRRAFQRLGATPPSPRLIRVPDPRS
jgi:hypothetical protein